MREGEMVDDEMMMIGEKKRAGLQLQRMAENVGATGKDAVMEGGRMDALSAAGLSGCVTNAVGALSGVSVMPSYVGFSRVNDLNIGSRYALLCVQQ